MLFKIIPPSFRK